MRLLHALLLMLLPAIVKAQSFPFRHYSVKDGLPHSNVYAMAEDSLGYLWFGTENGLTRFDGKEFVSFFRNSEPLSRGAVTALQFTTDGKLYAGTENNGVYRVDKNDITTVRRAGTKVHSVNAIGVQAGHVFIFHEFKNSELIADAGPQKNITVKFDTSLVPLCSKMTREGTILVGRQNGLFRIRDGKEELWRIQNFSNEPVHAVFEEVNGDLYLGCQGKILHVRNNRVAGSFSLPRDKDRNIEVLLRDRYSNFWLSFWGDDNLYVLTSEGSMLNLFENTGVNRGIVSRLLKDSNGDVWLSVLGQGVYRFSGLFLRNNFPGPSAQGTALTCMDLSIEGQIVFGTHNGLLFYDREKNSYRSAKLSPMLLEYVRDIRVKGDTVYVGITDMRLEEMAVKEMLFMTGTDTLRIIYRHASSLELVNNDLLIGNWDNRILIEPNGDHDKKTLLRAERNLSSLRVNCMSATPGGLLYVGTPLGLTVVDLEHNLRYSMHNHVLNSGINRMVKDPVREELQIYSDNGVAVFKNGKLLRCYENISEYRITAISETDDGSMFAGTTNGLYHLSKEDTIRIGMQEGLPSDQINDLRFDSKRNELIVITANGVSQISLAALRNHTAAPPRVLVSSIETTGRKIHFAGPVSIPYTDNLKLLNLSSLNSRDPGKPIRITTGTGEIYHVFSGKFDLSELSPGKHTLSICYVNEDGTTGRETTLYITLTPPFYRTTLFYLMAGISGTGLGLAGWRRKKQRRDKKQLEKTKVEYKMNLLKQQALVANLNPHFIFNALNAIQAFINTSDIRNANEYLALFSKLMRQQLNTAGRDLIPVSEELERLKNYLSIEKLRFGDKLEYTVETDERIRMHDVSIPNMIIQPFLENAIWHGFKGMKAQGHISLSLHFNESDELIIRIADNGKGIDSTVLSRPASKDPRGISLIRERLELLSETGSDVITFSELYPGNPMPGTVVTIRLSPRMFRFTA